MSGKRHQDHDVAATLMSGRKTDVERKDLFVRSEITLEISPKYGKIVLKSKSQTKEKNDRFVSSRSLTFELYLDDMVFHEFAIINVV